MSGDPRSVSAMGLEGPSAGWVEPLEAHGAERGYGSEPVAAPSPSQAPPADLAIKAATSSPEVEGDTVAAQYWERIVTNLRRGYPGADLTRVEGARLDCERLHVGQVRKSGEPYLHHPLRIALEASELGLDPDTVAIALLHDTLEDTHVTLDELKQRYGDVADVVDGLTKISATEEKGWERGKAQTYYKILVSTVRDIRTLIVKILDRLDNMRSLGAMRRDQQRRTAQETLDVYVPVAARLGLGEMSRELSRLSFQYLYPKRFAQMQREIEALRSQRGPDVEDLGASVRGALAAAGIEATVVAQWRDAVDYIHADRIVDDVLRGFKVLVEGEGDRGRVNVYAGLGVVHLKFRAVPGRIRDFISNPKPNGYSAVVTQVNRQGEILELALATKEMDLTNERGVLARWSNSPGELSEFYLRYLQLLETLTEDEDLRMADVLSHALPDQLQVFSPKGEAFTFPRRATCLDFAYRIHSTKVGDRAESATVNGRGVPVSTPLSDGDTVEIQTAADVRPTEQWLAWTVTARAHSSIRRSLKRQRRDRSREVGWDLFRLEAKRERLVATELIAKPEFQAVLRRHHLDHDEFLIQVGFRQVDPVAFLEEAKLLPASRKRRSGTQTASLLSRLLFRKASSDRPGFTIRDFNDAFIRLAGCCNPVVGEAVIGHLTTGNGITLHLESCPNLSRLDPSAQVTIEWEPGALPDRLKLDLLVDNQVGIIHRISKVISDLHVNIDEFRMDVSGDNGEFKLVLRTNAPKMIQRIVDSLRGLKGLQRVSQGV